MGRTKARPCKGKRKEQTRAGLHQKQKAPTKGRGTLFYTPYYIPEIHICQEELLVMCKYLNSIDFLRGQELASRIAITHRPKHFCKPRFFNDLAISEALEINAHLQKEA